MAKYNRFKGGSGAYQCRICGKQTRETGYDESSLELCAKCLLQEYVNNAQSDYGTGSEQYKQAVADLEKHNAKG
jgi:ribosome-binding protein aMBF1 (putative translation factor)